MSRNERNKRKKYREKFLYKTPNNTKEALLLDKRNGTTLWADIISNYMTEL